MYEQSNGSAPSQNERKINSLEIARLSGKNHRDLLRSIRGQEVAWSKITERNFALSEYTDVTGRKLPMYEFTKEESLYIISKFNDEVRAKLVKRWHELETKHRKGLKIYLHEVDAFELFNEYLIPGDNIKVARETGVTAKHVSKVKNGKTRSKRVMRALFSLALSNKRNDVTRGYPKKWIQEQLAFFEPQQRLPL